MNLQNNKKHTVLIVDDDQINCILLENIIGEEVDLLISDCGSDAIQQAKKHQPDLIILDIVMPTMNGFDAIKQLKEESETAAIPVIFISSLSETNHEAHAFTLGACDYIHKPFHPDIVKARVGLQLKLIEQRSMLERLAHIDPLTSIANRRKFTDQFEFEWLRCQEENLPLTVIMIDIDFFKKHNDSFGHSSGDAVLEKVAKTLTQTVERNFPQRGSLVARYGGEEFVLLLPDIAPNQIFDLTEACRTKIESLNIPTTEGSETQQKALTISLGAATCMPSTKSSKSHLLDAADLLLYKAKEQGRNQSCCQHNPIMKTY